MNAPRRSTLLPPALTLVLLLGLGVDTFSRPEPEDAEPYHRRIRQVQERIHDQTRVIGNWVGHDVEPTKSAIELLQPNVIYQRTYVNTRSGRRVNVLLVQCKDARDIHGHYPPVCYPAQGMEMKSKRPVDWRVEGRRLTGMEYAFRGRAFTSGGLIVDNLILMPGEVARDMDKVTRSAWDYLKRFYGAAQLQVVFQDTDFEEGRRREIFRTMVRAHMPIIDAIIGEQK